MHYSKHNLNISQPSQPLIDSSRKIGSTQQSKTRLPNKAYSNGGFSPVQIEDQRSDGDSLTKVDAEGQFKRDEERFDDSELCLESDTQSGAGVKSIRVGVPSGQCVWDLGVEVHKTTATGTGTMCEKSDADEIDSVELTVYNIALNKHLFD